jgi:hypothetical protein
MAFLNSQSTSLLWWGRLDWRPRFFGRATCGPVRRHTAMNVRNRLTLTEQRRAAFMALIDYEATLRIEPMTLGNMRERCPFARRVMLDLSPSSGAERGQLADHLPVPTFGPRMVCTHGGIIGADARPNWKDQPPARR